MTENHPVPPDAVAITGMACIFPGAPDLASYWRNILSQIDAITEPPPGSWDPQVFYDPTSRANDRTYCKRGGYIGDLAQFQPLDFGIMPANVDGGEPDQWLALQVARAALADAGYSGSPGEYVRAEVILGKGTYINRGNMTVGYHGFIVEQVLQVLKNLHPEYSAADIDAIKQEMKAGLPPFSADTAPALIGNIIAGRIANRLDLMGPAFTVDAACASALVAADIAIHDLLSRKCDLALVGGVNVHTPLPTFILFCQLGALSRREQIRPFDKDADGTILGEGLGMVVLKRLEDAERDQDRIYAVIRGVGTASDGRALHVMAPRVEGEEMALRLAYEMAGVPPSSVGLIEAHGTATPVGDAVEIQALSRVFGERCGLLPSCAIGSVKSMIGHTMPAAGIAGMIKTALALYHRVLPPTLHCDEPNPALELEKTPFYVNAQTRPWIHGAATPRRAGVNAFGFGGINGHVLLEEYSGNEQAGGGEPLPWETEVCILEGASRRDLLEQAERVQGYLQHVGQGSLKNLAYTLSEELQGKSYRLAIVAASLEDLGQKLTRAQSRLAGPQCQQIKDNRGIYFFEEPLARLGKLAFLFPGEGAQYENMLLDLCLYFPEVRRCFDLHDRAFAGHPRDYVPSDYIFPRSIASEAERRVVQHRLWQIDGAIEAVLIANRAMWALMSGLQIRADAMLGHSTGEYSAMFASGMIRLDDESSYIRAILASHATHARLGAEYPVAEAALVAIAADAATVRSIVQQTDTELHIAMENCPHQNIVVGSRPAVEQVVEQLRQRGLIYEFLPFDRPYHTPMFAPYAERAGREFLSRHPLSAPNIEVYSCTTAAPYPTSPAEIEEIFVAHWVRPVLFQQTIERMYADGVRIFVEVGPRGNLTAFVDDILRGSPHLAMPSNVARRSGITQLNHLVGVLAAQGIPVNLQHLYARRNPRRVRWDFDGPEDKAKHSVPPRKILLGTPELRVAPRHPGAVPPQPQPVASRLLRSREDRDPPPAIIAATVEHRPNGTPHTGAVEASLVMQEYARGMESFLELQQLVMQTFLSNHRGPQQRKNGDTGTAFSAPRFPMLGNVISLVPNQELVARRRLDQNEDTFLLEHALGGPLSTTDPGLKPLMVVPLTISMEMLAEAAAVLMPGKVLIGMRDIQARQWIEVDEPVTLQISARRLAEAPDEVEVQVQNLGGEAAADPSPAALPVLLGTMIFAEAHPPAPPIGLLSLAGERPSRLSSADLYGSGIMFHGPCFQGVAAIQQSGQNGLLATLKVLSPEGLFRSDATPRFITDPVVLDAAGQLVGFWAAEYLDRGFVVFPYRLESLNLYAHNQAVGERITCRLKLELVGDNRIRSDVEICGADGRLWMRLNGWEDRRFDPPQRFHRFWISPRAAPMSVPWRRPLEPLPESGGFECWRLEMGRKPGNALWQDLWASLVLGRRERQAFRRLKAPPIRQQEWLSGRTAAKDAVRSFLKEHYQLDLFPADIEIVQDEHGRPTAEGPWIRELPAAPRLSLTHSNGVAIAVAGHGHNNAHLGIDLEMIRQLPVSFERVAFDSAERDLLAAIPEPARTEWILRLWCAKEAVAKALGRGLVDGPRSIRIQTFEPGTGLVAVALQGQLAAAFTDFVDADLLAYTVTDGDYVIAATLCERKAS